MASENGQSEMQDQIKEVISFLGGIGAISYAAGFIVVTTNLLQYGISDLNLLNARYVSAGFFFIFLLGLTMVPAINLIYFTSHIMGHKLENPPIKYPLVNVPSSPVPTSCKESIDSILKLLLSTLLALIAPLIVIIITSTKTWLQAISLSSILSLLSFISMLLSSISPLFSILLLRWFAPIFVTGFLLYLIIHPISNENWISNIPNSLWLIGGVVLCLLVAINSYAFVIYPSISPAMGGGDAVDVSLVFDNDSVQMMKQLVPLETNSNSATVPLRLLDESDKDYFLLVTDGGINASNVSFHAVKIDKSLVKGVTYSYNTSRLTKSWSYTSIIGN